MLSRDCPTAAASVGQRNATRCGISEADASDLAARLYTLQPDELTPGSQRINPPVKQLFAYGDLHHESNNPPMTSRWPEKLWIVRHGQSAGNVARDNAHSAQLDRLQTGGRDVDVPLSKLGERQARALGGWFAAQTEEDRPNAVLVSPYARAVRTAAILREAGTVSADEPLCVDERLREREFGILDGLTTQGVRNLMPDQAEFRRVLGKFYHRPPGGESWCDVILRLRSVLDTMALHYAGRRVIIVAHQVVVLCLRYIIEKLDEAQILAVDAEGDVANCSITQYRLDSTHGQTGGMTLERYNFTVPMEEKAVSVTAEQDARIGAGG
jgi:broad specificity phosphatase PhoE